MRTDSTASLLRKLARWVPSAHFSHAPDRTLCLSTPRWLRAAADKDQPLRQQVIGLLEAAQRQTSDQKLRAEADYALTMMGRKRAVCRHFAFEIVDF